MLVETDSPYLAPSPTGASRTSRRGCPSSAPVRRRPARRRRSTTCAAPPRDRRRRVCVPAPRFRSVCRPATCDAGTGSPAAPATGSDHAEARRHAIAGDCCSPAALTVVALPALWLRQPATSSASPRHRTSRPSARPSPTVARDAADRHHDRRSDRAPSTAQHRRRRRPPTPPTADGRPDHAVPSAPRDRPTSSPRATAIVPALASTGRPHVPLHTASPVGARRHGRPTSTTAASMTCIDRRCARRPAADELVIDTDTVRRRSPTSADAPIPSSRHQLPVTPLARRRSRELLDAPTAWRRAATSARTSSPTPTRCGASPAWPASAPATASSRSAPGSAR